MVVVPAGGKAEFTEKLFIGPKLQSQLAATAPNLERTVDYGKLTVLAHPVFVGARVGTRPHRQLGLVHHHRHGAHQTAVLSA